MWLMHPPRRLRLWLYGVFLLLTGIELSAFGRADVNGLTDTSTGDRVGCWAMALGYVS